MNSDQIDVHSNDDWLEAPAARARREVAERERAGVGPRELVMHFIEHVNAAGDGPAAREASAMKLRVSLMAQSTMTSLRAREDVTPSDARQLRADASELCYIKSQPTADDIILRSIGVLPQPL